MAAWKWPEAISVRTTITLWNAKSLDNAIEQAEAEAVIYSRENKLKFLKFSQVYRTDSKALLAKKGMEAFSLLRESNLKPKPYLDQFFDTGGERQSDCYSEPDAGANRYPRRQSQGTR